MIFVLPCLSTAFLCCISFSLADRAVQLLCDSKLSISHRCSVPCQVFYFRILELFHSFHLPFICISLDLNYTFCLTESFMRRFGKQALVKQKSFGQQKKSTGGRPTQDLAGGAGQRGAKVFFVPVARQATVQTQALRAQAAGRPAQELAGDQPKNWRATSPRDRTSVG